MRVPRRHVFVAGKALAFDIDRTADGQVRTDVWDRFTSWGEKIKEGRLSVFDELTLGQMVDNWLARGDQLAMCFNHQSAYVQQNGQPAPSLAFYDALAVVQGGKVVRVAVLPGSRAPQVGTFEAAARGDGLYGFRCEVTQLGQELLPNFKFISPMFTDDGRDEQGNEIGYVLYDVAATNTPFQAGCEITFDKGQTMGRFGSGEFACIHCGQRFARSQLDGGSKIPAHRDPSKGSACGGEGGHPGDATNYTGADGAQGERKMAKLGKLAKFVGLKDDADDSAIKQSLSRKLEEESYKAMEEESYNYDDAADAFEEMAAAYEEAKMEEEGGSEAPHVTMRKMAAKFRRFAKMAKLEIEGNGGPGQVPTGGQQSGQLSEKDKATMAAADEEKKKDQLQAFAQRLGVTLPKSATSQQMMDALSASTVKASDLHSLIEAQVTRTISARDEQRAKTECAEKSKVLMSSLRDDTPEANKKALQSLAADPKTFESAVALASPFLRPEAAGPQSLLFSRMTGAGAPLALAADARRSEAAGGRRVVSNELATFVIDDEGFAAKAREYADATSGPMKMAVDELLSESERGESYLRLIAANRLVKQKHPEMWDAIERARLNLF